MFVDPGGEVVTADEAVGASCDRITVDKENEEWDTLYLKSVDKRWVITRIDRSDRDLKPTGKVAEDGFHALTDATAVGIKLHERDARLRNECIEVSLSSKLCDSGFFGGRFVRVLGHTYHTTSKRITVVSGFERYIPSFPAASDCGYHVAAGIVIGG